MMLLLVAALLLFMCFAAVLSFSDVLELYPTITLTALACLSAMALALAVM